jgi:hypothetical protein
MRDLASGMGDAGRAGPVASGRSLCLLPSPCPAGRAWMPPGSCTTSGSAGSRGVPLSERTRIGPTSSPGWRPSRTPGSPLRLRLGAVAEPCPPAGPDREAPPLPHHAVAPDRLRGGLQPAASAGGAPVSELVQVHRRRGGTSGSRRQAGPACRETSGTMSAPLPAADRGGPGAVSPPAIAWTVPTVRTTSPECGHKPLPLRPRARYNSHYLWAICCACFP